MKSTIKLLLYFLWLKYMEKRGEIARKVDEYCDNHHIPAETKAQLMPLVDSLFLWVLNKFEEETQ